MHEEEAGAGGALDPARREEDVNLLRQLGATVTRSHYPLHPETLELCDQAGILVWDESPVYQLKGKQLSSPIARAHAKDFIAQEIRRDRNHASVFAWSVSNELPPRPKAGEERLLNTLVDTVKSLDTTRLVAIDVGAYPSVGTPDIYSRFDAVGINDYFGWYPGPGGSTADRTKLSGYLDNEHAYHPHQAIFVTEFGAEANRAGPVDEKGTFGFQRDFLAYHLGVFAKKRWLAGAIIWILRDFRTRPGWAGGNPTPDPPINFKGLVDDADKPKPAFDEVARLFNQTRQIVLRRLRR